MSLITDIAKQSPKADFAAAAQTVTPRLRKRYPRITLRLSETEEAELKRLAHGMSMSAYVRECVFGPDQSHRRKRRSYKPVADQQSMAKALALLGQSHMANNLNQLAHHANIGSLEVSDVLTARINEAYAHILEMRSALFEALGRQDGV